MQTIAGNYPFRVNGFQVVSINIITDKFRQSLFRSDGRCFRNACEFLSNKTKVKKFRDLGVPMYLPKFNSSKFLFLLSKKKNQQSLLEADIKEWYRKFMNRHARHNVTLPFFICYCPLLMIYLDLVPIIVRYHGLIPIRMFGKITEIYI